MVRTVTAFCPGHISGYFRRVPGPDAASTGSVGAGIVISEGVLARVAEAGHTTIGVYRMDENGKQVLAGDDSPPVRFAMERIGVHASVRTECHLPIGAGFGLSAAALLAALTALDRLYDLTMTEKEIATIAHETEVIHSTGLGDVASCRGGGMVVRTVAGIHAPIRRYLDLGDPVCALSFGPIHTPSILGSSGQMEKVATAFPHGEPATVTEFFEKARAFARGSGLMTPQVAEVLQSCEREGVPAGMTMLGNGVFAYGENAGPVLARYGTVYRMAVAKNGPRIVSEDA